MDALFLLDTVLHELGHAAGLEHVEAGDQLMRVQIENGRLYDSYQSGDAAGLAQLRQAGTCA
jgi:predicted Zn-dependent protease